MENNSKIIHIMDIPFYNGTKEEIIQDDITTGLKEKEKMFIVTANPEIVMETRKNETYKKIVQSASKVVPDGIGILMAAKRKKTPLKERIAGFDLFMDMLRLANEQHATCYFLGAADKVNELAVHHVKEQFPNIEIVGRQHGYIDINDQRIVEQVKSENPDFVFVALGFPKQEQWIDQYYEEFNKGIFIGLGGSFDVLAGNVKRAPDIWIKLRLEWFYRIALQPSRWKRFIPLVKFSLLTFFKRI